MFAPLLALSLLVSPAFAHEDPDPILEHAATLLDDRATPADRAAAATQLVESGDPRVFAFLRAAVRDRMPEIQVLALQAAARYPHPESVAMAEWVLLGALSERAPKDAAIDLLQAMGSAPAADLLFAVTGTRKLPASLRKRAVKVLETTYPDDLARLGPPRTVADPIGAVAGSIANGVAGGVLLSSVGEWGKSDTAIAIGAVGGSMIGVGTGILYSQYVPMTAGQGLLYASGVGWGLTFGIHAETALFWGRGIESQGDWAAALRVAGVSTGAALALWGFRRDPSAQNVIEIDLAGYLGASIAHGVTDLAVWREPAEPDWVDHGDGEEPSPTVWDDYERDRIDARNKALRAHAVAALAGGLAGIGLGVVTQDKWDLDWNDALFASVLAGEGAYAGAFLPMALGVDRPWDVHGNIRATMHLTALAGLIISEVAPVSPGRSMVTLYGSVVGNALGAGIPLLGRGDDRAAWATAMLCTGVAGTAAGYGLAKHLDPSVGDWSMLAVGVPLAIAESTAIAVVLDENDQLHDNQYAGIVLTGSAAVAGGLMALTRAVEPEPIDMMFLGTSALWGTWYGLVTPLGLDLNLDTADHALVTTVTADAFLVGGGVALLAGLPPKKTLIPQLAGVGGATIGSLVVALATDDDAKVALGAVVGSTVGLGAGALTVALVGDRVHAPALRLPRLHLPGRWTPSLAPTVIDGEVGVGVGLSVDGW